MMQRDLLNSIYILIHIYFGHDIYLNLLQFSTDPDGN